MEPRRLSVTVREDVAAEAETLGVDIDAVTEAALVRANELARRAAWVSEHRDSLETHGRRFTDEDDRRPEISEVLRGCI